MPARAWRPAVVARLARTLGLKEENPLPTPLEGRKIRFEIAEKALISATLIIAIVGSFYKGYEFLSAKSLETKKKTESIELLTAAYLDSLKSVNAELKEVDEKMAQAPWKGSFDWEKYVVIREAKSKDRALLLERLGSQIVELKKAESK